MAGGLLLAGSGCTSSPRLATSPHRTGAAAPSSTGATAPSPTTTPTTTTQTPERAQLPPARLWRPNAGDVEPVVKATAVRVVETIGSWRHGPGTQAGARRRLTQAGLDPSLAAQAPALLSESAIAGVVHVIEAQYGGLLSTTASVLVPLRQWRLMADGTVANGGTTVDVRLQKTGSTWRVVALHPARPGPPDRPFSRLERAVLTSRRIDLPPAATADVMSGRVHPSVFEAMLRLSRTYRIGVSVIRSGHPLYVFGTDRPSDHPKGKAFDTFHINDRLVVDVATPRGLVTGYMRAAADAGSYNVGGPYLLAGVGDQFFSDATHHDHVHAGFAT